MPKHYTSEELLKIKMAPPDVAAACLQERGYIVTASALRYWAKAGKLCAVWTGKKMLINIDRAIEVFNNGMDAEPPPEQELGVIRKVEE